MSVFLYKVWARSQSDRASSIWARASLTPESACRISAGRLPALSSSRWAQMPSLDELDLIALRSAPMMPCERCDRMLFKYYCREHDVEALIAYAGALGLTVSLTADNRTGTRHD